MAAAGVSVEFEEEKEEEERKQEAVERKDAGTAPQGIQGLGFSQEKVMKMTFRMSRQPRGAAAKRTRKR